MPAPEPRWLQLAREQLGVREIAGAEHNAEILSWWETIKLRIRDDETPYCAAFVGAMLERAGVASTRSAAARSYVKWGARLTFPVVGCVVIFSRPPSTWSGHVGFVVGTDKSDNIVTLGANQSNTVSIAPFKRDRVLGYRWPLEAGYPHATPLDLPRIDTAAATSNNEA